PIESGEDRDDAVAHRDVVDVRAVQDHRRAGWIAEELREAGERGELAAVSRMPRVRTALALVAAREDDEVDLGRAHRVDAEAPSRERPRGEGLDDDVGGRDEPEGERDRGRL